MVEHSGGTAVASRIDFSEIVTRHETALLRYVRQWVDSDEAEDVVQEAFLKLHAQLARDGVDGVRNHAAWLFRVAHNLAVDAGKKEKRRDETHRRMAEQTPVRADEEGECDVGRLVRRAACDKALEEVRRLPDLPRQILLLKVIHGSTLREIGDVTGVAPSHAAYHLNKALTDLARKLKSAGVI